MLKEQPYKLKIFLVMLSILKPKYIKKIIKFKKDWLRLITKR